MFVEFRVCQRNGGGLKGKAEQGSGKEVGLHQEVESSGVRGRAPADRLQQD